MASLEDKREILALLDEKARRQAVRDGLPRTWRPRASQDKLWAYLEGGGTRAVEIAHRRWGKDDVALHWACKAAHRRVGTYWHMLPQANQARKAIWDAVNPHTGKRRIDEAFPVDLRSSAREQDMLIRLACGSTWQVVGSDNFNSLVGSPPLGIVFSEWALADPYAWSYLRPILDENGGWALFITTPRGRNHARRTYDLAQSEPGWFAELLTARETGVFSEDDLVRIRREMIGEWGEDDGVALFDQEYMCSFDAPLVGSFYAKLLEQAEQQDRVVDAIAISDGVPVETAWDLGYSDDTTIWFFQMVGREIRILDYYAASGQDVAHYCNVITRKAAERGWSYGSNPRHWVPWDARPKTLASGGRSILEQAWSHGVKMRVVANLDVMDGIQAVRMMMPRCWFDKTHCADGIEALRNYQREWDEERKVFKRHPLHNWASHAADAFRYLALGWRERIAAPPPPPPIQGIEGLSLDRLLKDDGRRRQNGGLI